MNKLIAFALVACAVALGIAVTDTKAVAAPIYQFTLSVTDAGSSMTKAITKQARYCVQDTGSAGCLKLATGSVPTVGATGAQSADCTKDVNLGPYDVISAGNTNKPTGPLICFDSAGSNLIVARAWDGGSPDVNVYLDTQNLPR